MHVARVTAVAALLFVAPPPMRASAEDPVWCWYTSCGGPTIVVEVRLDNQLIHKTTIPLCHVRREAAPTRDESRVVDVHFTPSRAIEWTGYRDKPDVTPSGHSLALNLWQAGADPDALTIGVTVADGRMLYMNTVHIAHPDRRDETEIARGVVVATYPRATSAKAAKP